MLRRLFVLAIAIVPLLSTISIAAESLPKKPNIVFIMADDLGYGELSCYGQQILRTPNIDRLAAEGLKFTDVYAGSTVCAPSRCVLMTGLHTGHCRVRGNQRVPLLPDDVTVAEVLRDAGYVTGMFGKWGLGEPGTTGLPTRQGFEHWFGYLNQGNAHNYYPEYLWDNEQQFPLVGNVAEKGVASKKAIYSHDIVTDRALGFLEGVGDKPFFLYVPFTLPHVNNELRRATGDGMEVPNYGPYANEDWPNPEKGRAMMIHMLDRDVGRIMDKIRKLGLDENTLVFFTSDNGAQQEGGSKLEFFNSSGPLRGFKRDLYEGGIRVPMIARWPGVIEAGTVSDLPWAFWDFLPTAAELAGAAAPQGLDGLSVVPTLVGEDRAGHPQQQHGEMYWEFHERGSKQAVRRGKYKAVRLSPELPLELYNLETDLGETNNIADAHPELVAELEDYLTSARSESEHWPLRKRQRRRK
ncbi:Arylsulfatase [Symmachiella macrocystis]|uniref:Arylsulfatase n=1 Tax=Symmachiella macrocystis TaxID=2527985 RepID=A0A5C6BNA5_9PLAN|nr:arylsulfatase [Symmachiella macrocystis]TWU12786.1 Arylsulfatase [Symmachiella macrocystis]